jgi:transcription initiation factor TFIID subunit 8
VLRSVCNYLPYSPVALCSSMAATSTQLIVIPDMIHQLSTIATSMTSCRRSQPTPQDFAFALRKENLPLSSLEPHLQLLIPPSISQQSLPTPPPEDPPDMPLSPVLGPALCGTLDKQKTPHVPTHFPSYPSKHTYKATPEFTKREEEPRKVRERATEEARLGEEALRKLLRAASGGGHCTDGNSGLINTKRKQRDRMWEQTVEALRTGTGISSLPNGDPGIGAPDVSTANKNSAAMFPPEFGVVVNSEKCYWRKSAAAAHSRSRRRQPGTIIEDGDIRMGGTGSSCAL